MLKNDYYTYRVTWSVDDEQYAGLCTEFPSLSWLAADHDAALKGIRKLVNEVILDMSNNGEEIPESVATKKYSGRFMVRIPPELHRQLALQALEAGISLNRLASDRLSRTK